MLLFVWLILSTVYYSQQIFKQCYVVEFHSKLDVAIEFNLRYNYTYIRYIQLLPGSNSNRPDTEIDLH